MSKTLSLSLICSNNYKDIQSSLKEIKKISHLFKDIVVVDGNSSDGTVDYISKTIPEIKIIKVNYKNRLAQRIESFNNTKGDLILIMDIDDIVDEKAINLNVNYLIENNLSGVQFRLRSDELKSLSSRCWDSLMLSLYKPMTKTKILGRPSITRREYLIGINFPSCFKERGEDLFIATKQEELFKNINFKIGEGVGFKKTEISLIKSFRKFYNYGFGDAFIISQNPKKVFNLIYNQLINYSIILTFKSFLRFQFIEGLIISFWGIARFSGMMREFINLLTNHNIDKTQ